MWLRFSLLGIFIISHGGHSETLPNSCDSPVYCYGDLLRTVQLARVYPDGKTFVDLKMKNSQAKTLENFAKIGPNPNKTIVTKFVNENFEKGNELMNWTLPDYNPTPNFIKNIINTTVLNFTQELIQEWPKLARHVKAEVNQTLERYSFIPVPHGFIVPGGRFQEYYYWDSYWVIDGLLLNEMHVTARGMIDNFISLVERFGFVPNGGRIYYLQRSQPPLLTPMAHLYYENTKNITWLKQNIDSLAKELNYWIKQTVTVQRGFRTYTLAQYNSPSAGPRPESYWEDVKTAEMVEEAKKQDIYTDLKSGAESGWDFSARWVFDQNGGNVANLSHIQTRRVIPVDLNAFLCGAFRDISELYRAIDPAHNQSIFWEKNYLSLQEAISEILWDEQDGIWYDYDIKLDQHRKFFYPSGLTPLWSKCFNKTKGNELGERALKYLLNTGVLEYLGGIPTSDDNTGEQWDYPNAWPPLQDLVVRGLENSGHPEAQKEAKILAERWVSANMIGYNNTGFMFEKYHAEVPGKHGGGGEYEVQAGFGWSNGVALRFIHDYYTVNSSYNLQACGVLFWVMYLIIKIVC